MFRRYIALALVALFSAAAAPGIEATGTPVAPITGTWHVKVPLSDGGFPPFEALHTYHDDGTFTETSSNFATLTEGPSHGVWKRHGGKILLTFQLFVFENGVATGQVRVRAEIWKVTLNTFEAKYAVDLIDPDGNVIPGVDTGTFSARRIRVAPL
jgi:hypothetical protein